MVLAHRLAGVRRPVITGIAAPGQPDHHVLYQFFRVKGLARSKRRADRFATSALHAGIEPQ